VTLELGGFAPKWRAPAQLRSLRLGVRVLTGGESMGRNRLYALAVS